jgi:hypothetical protein
MQEQDNPKRVRMNINPTIPVQAYIDAANKTTKLPEQHPLNQARVDIDHIPKPIKVNNGLDEPGDWGHLAADDLYE